MMRINLEVSIEHDISGYKFSLYSLPPRRLTEHQHPENFSRLTYSIEMGMSRMLQRCFAESCE